MADLKKKESFGTIKVHHISPELPESTPTAINLHLSFEEALKLHLGLGQLLGQLNSYDRKGRAAKRTGANLCLFTNQDRITINESRSIDDAPEEE